MCEHVPKTLVKSCIPHFPVMRPDHIPHIPKQHAVQLIAANRLSFSFHSMPFALDTRTAHLSVDTIAIIEAKT